MIRQNHPADFPAGWQRHFKRIPFHLGGNRTNNRQTRFRIVCPRRKHQRRSPPRLFAPRLRSKVQPHQVPRFRQILLHAYHASFPRGSSQSTSAWTFSGLIPSTNSFSVNFFSGFCNFTAPESSTSSSIASPAFHFAALATCFGIRTARLLPHRESCVFMESHSQSDIQSIYLRASALNLLPLAN